MEGHNQTADPPETYGGDLAGRIARFIEAIVEWAGRLMMVLVFAIVMLVATNVILRYLFAIGPVSLQELECHLMVPVALIGSAYTLRHHGHVRVDIFYDGFGARTRAVVNLFSSIGLLVTSAAGDDGADGGRRQGHGEHRGRRSPQRARANILG